MKINYYERIMDNLLEEELNNIGAILIVGPKWCGKTTTAKKHSKSFLLLDDPKRKKSNLELLDLDPLQLLNGDKPRLIDEWQIAPQIWDTVRHSVDDLQEQGLYILTGSTSVNEKEIMHSGTGRISRLLMRPMSLFESKESNGKISILDLFNNPDLNINGIESDLSIKDLIFATCRGGWPYTLNMKSKKSQLSVSKNYLNSICENDISTVDGVKRNPELVRMILQSYSRNISTLATNKTIMKDVSSNHDISKTTFYSYINALKRLYVIDNLPAWSPKIRSRTSIRSTDKKEFIDPSIAVASLKVSPEILLNDLETLGFIFENLCIRDLKVYSSSMNGHLSYYRDKYNLEVDCVLHLDDGRYALFEFKLGSIEIDKAAKNLLKLNNLIKKSKKDNTYIREPTFLAVITGGEIAYTRKDGVKVLPIGCLC